MKVFANALLDSRRAAACSRTEEQPSVCREAIGESKAQRKLGADDGQVDRSEAASSATPPRS
jgi:hypothetical protein